MRYRHLFSLLILFSLVNLTSWGQTEIDTVKASLKAMKSKEQIEVLNRLAETFKDENIDLSLDYWILAYQAALKLGENEAIILQAERVGDIYTQTGNYTLALDYYTIALNHAKREDNPQHFSTIFRLMGNVYYYLGEFDKCLEAHLESLNYAETNNNEGGIAAAYNNIGLINTTLEKYDIALDYYQKAEKVFAKMDNLTNQGMAIINIGNIHYFNNNLDEALAYYQKAYNIFKKTEKPLDIALAAQNIGMIFFDKGDLGKAEEYYLLSLEYAKQANTLSLLINSYTSLNQLYEKKGEYEKAYKYLYQQYILNDSLHRNQTTEKLTELESKYQVSQKEEENQMLKRQFTYISILGVFVLIVLLFNYRLKVISNRNLREKNLQIENQNKELAEINATKNRFFSIIAHDLKNPLAAFAGLMEVFQQQLPEMPKEEQENFLKQIALLSETMLDLLENLLKWSRSQIGIFEFKPANISLNKVVADSKKVVFWNAQLKGITIESKIESEITIFADENMIATVIRNLLGNAVKFTPMGGKISVYASTSDYGTSLYVKDNGIGISEEDQERLFRIDSKLRNPGTANEPGSGLGLILCKEFIEKLGGKMIIKSTLNEGSTFGFTLKN